MRNLALVFAVLLHGFGGAAGAQSEAEAAIALELNRVDQTEGACRLTFMATNALGADVEALTVETVLIDAEGVVERLTLFEFGALPAGTPRVRQFDLPDLECGVLGRVLVNGVAECTGAEDCAERMDLSSRVDIELIG